MKIIIKKALRDSVWYTDKIGEIFEVENAIDAIGAMEYYRLPQDPVVKDSTGYIHVEDVAVLDNNEENYSVNCKCINCGRDSFPYVTTYRENVKIWGAYMCGICRRDLEVLQNKVSQKV